jgi:hypothetical protein
MSSLSSVFGIVVVYSSAKSRFGPAEWVRKIEVLTRFFLFKVRTAKMIPSTTNETVFEKLGDMSPLSAQRVESTVVILLYYGMM